MSTAQRRHFMLGLAATAAASGCTTAQPTPGSPAATPTLPPLPPAATLATDAGVEHTIEWYPALHGFAVPDNAPYDEAAAERHWAAMKDFFGAHLAA